MTSNITLTKGSISVTIGPANVVASGYYWDGQPWVQVAAGQTVVVVGWSPAAIGSGSSLRNGAQKNPRGNTLISDVAAQGVDGREQYSNTLTFAAGSTLATGDTLVIATAGAGDGNNNTIARPAYHPLPARSRVDREIVLSVVSAAPVADAFRPSAIGNPAARITKLQSQIQWGNLPALFSSSHVQTPSLSSCETFWAEFCGDLVTGWTSDKFAPNFQHPGYGQNMAAAVSESLMLACSDLPLAQKQTLVKRLIQWGIDYWGAFADGRENYALGGHMQGRKALVIFAGHMLGDAAMAAPSTTLADTTRFQEDFAYFTSGAARWDGPSWKWRYSDGVAASAYQDDNPSTWALGPDNVPQFWERYHSEITIGAQLGSAMAMAAIGRTEEWDRAAWATMVGHMTRWPASWAAAQQAQIPFYPNAVGKAWSHRGANAATWISDQWRTTLLRLLMHRRQTYLVVPADEQALPIAFDLPQYGSFNVEVYNGPVADVTGTEVWLGHMLDAPLDGDPNGFEQWSDAQVAIDVGDPNAYGWHTFGIDLQTQVTSDDAARAEARWCLQVVYRGTPHVSVPLVFTIPV